MAKGNNTGLAMALRNLRHEHGWTLADVSSLTGIPASTLSKVENAKLSLSYDKLLQLSRGIGVDITKLFDETSSSTRNIEAPSNRRSVMRAGEGHFVQTRSYDHRYLATDLLSKRI